MPVRNQNWYDLQAGRRYPLDDRSTGIADDGSLIDDSLLVDCHIRFPSTLGAVGFVQAITVSGTLVTVLIGVADAEHTPASVKTIAAVSVPKPAQLNKNYAITPLIPGVAGWLVFGAGIANEFTGRYATPEQSMLLPRCARAYQPLPIPTIGKLNLATALDDVVRLEAVPPLAARRTTLTINDKTVQAIEFRLDGNLTNVTYNPLEYFLGECGQRPESGTCPKQPIETINGIAPDCNGNINITSTDFIVYPFTGGGGLGLDFPLGLPDVCDKTRYKPPREGVDKCEPSSSSSSSSTSASSGSSAVTETSSGSTIAYTGLPFCLPLAANFAVGLRSVSGRFAAKARVAPSKCGESLFGSSSSSSAYASSSSSSSSSSSVPEVPQVTQIICAADDPFSTNIATLKNYPTDWAANCRISTAFKIAPGIANNAGLIFNYRHSGLITYFVAVVDVDRGAFMLLRYNGYSFVVEYTLNLAPAGFVFDATQWHTIAVTPVVSSDPASTTVQCELSNVAGSQHVSFTVTTANYGAAIGASGLFADRAYAYFNSLAVEAV